MFSRPSKILAVILNLSMILLYHVNTASTACIAKEDEGPQQDVLCAGASGTGYNGTLACAGESSGFDDAFTIGSSAAYGSVRWAVLNDFTFQNHSTADPIAPITCPNYLRASAGHAVVYPGLNYEVPGGASYTTLRAFAFACADPVSRLAVPCNLSVSAFGVNRTSDGCEHPHRFGQVFGYAPDHTKNASMKAVDTTNMLNAAKQNTTEWQTFPRHGYNYTFTATQVSGKAAVLYVDDISYNWWYSRS